MMHVRPCRASVIRAVCLLAAVACMACSLSGCASKSAGAQREAAAPPQREAVALSRDYVAEVIRYLYRWHAD